MKVLLVSVLLLACGGDEALLPETWTGKLFRYDEQGDVIAAVECNSEGCTCHMEMWLQECEPVGCEEEAWECCDG